MILDELTEFCDATALNTGAPGTYLIGDQVSLKQAGDIGHGEPLYVVIQVDTTATSGGAATAKFHVVSDDSAAIATNGTATYHVSTGAISLANLAAGKAVLTAPLPSGTYEPYLGILQETGTAAFTGGKVNAFLTHDITKWTALPDAL